MTNIDKDRQKLVSSFITDVVGKWYNCFQKQLVNSLKRKYGHAVCPEIPLMRMPRTKIHPTETYAIHICSSDIPNGQKVEITQIYPLIHQRINKVCISTGIIFPQWNATQ